MTTIIRWFDSLLASMAEIKPRCFSDSWTFRTGLEIDTATSVLYTARLSDWLQHCMNRNAPRPTEFLYISRLFRNPFLFLCRPNSAWHRMTSEKLKVLDVVRASDRRRMWWGIFTEPQRGQALPKNMAGLPQPFLLSFLLLLLLQRIGPEVKHGFRLCFVPGARPFIVVGVRDSVFE